MQLECVKHHNQSIKILVGCLYVEKAEQYQSLFFKFSKKKKKAGAPIFPGFSPYRSVYFEVKDRQEFPTCTYFWFCCWFVFILLVCFYTGFCVNYFATIMPTYAIIAMKWELCQLCVCTTLLRVDQ